MRAILPVFGKEAVEIFLMLIAQTKLQAAREEHDILDGLIDHPLQGVELAEVGSVEE